MKLLLHASYRLPGSMWLGAPRLADGVTKAACVT